MATSVGGTIISSSNGPTVIYLRLTDFRWCELGMWLVSIQSCFHTKMKETRQTANKGVSIQFSESVGMAISFIQHSFSLSSPSFIRDFSCLFLVTFIRLSFSLCGETENPYRHSSVRLNLIDEWKNF